MSEQLKKSYTLGGIDVDHDYKVSIPCQVFSLNPNNEHTIWTESSVKALELFGLPGDKYTCRFTSSNIEFWFRDEKDAMLFELCCG